jgi:DNA-binding HxlR family transcriptional regulator
MIVLYTLMEFDVVRFNEMKRYIGSVTDKTLSTTLHELERDSLIVRIMYPQIPPKVEYSLTDAGRSLIPILDGMCE